MLDPNNPFADLVPSSGAPPTLYGPPEVPKLPTPPSQFDIGKQENTESNQAFDNTTNLRKEFTSSKDYLAYAGSMRALAASIKQPPTPQGDLAVIYNYAKTMDPDSAVREGELDLAQSGASMVAQLKKRYNMVTEGATLPPGVREKLIEAMRGQAKGYNIAYSGLYQRTAKIAEQQGINPKLVVADHVGELYAPVEAGWVSEQNGQNGAMENAATLVPAGEGPQGRRLSAEQEKEYAAFLRSKPDAAGIVAWLAARNVGTDNAEEVAKALREGRAVGPPNYSQVDAAAEAAARAEVERQGPDLLGPAQTLVTSGATLNLSDEAAGVGRGLSYAVQGKNPVAGYQLGRDAERLRIADARKQLGYGGTALEVAGGFLSANPEAVLAPAINALSTIRQGARAGAYGGALAGFGAGEGTQDTAEKTALGGVAGAALGAGISGISSRYAPRGMNPELAAASEAEGVDLMRPMVDPNEISNYGALESNIYSQPIIRGGAARVRGQIEDRVGALGQGGATLETEAAGGRIQQGARDFIKRSKGVADSLYNRARSLAGDATITPKAALTQLRQELQALNETPQVNQGEITFINELGADLTKGPLSVDAVRGLRASVRGRINQSGLTATQADARAMRIIDALQADATGALPPAAASAFKRADTYYRERMTHIDDVIGRFLGPKNNPVSGEQAFSRLKSMTSPGGDGRRLGALMRELDGNERQDIAATIAQSLGRRSSDEPFSTALFVQQTRKLSPSARKTIFGPDGAESIDNLRLLSQKLEMAEKDINRSRSATVLERQGFRMAARNFIATIAGLGGTAAAASGHLAGGAAGITVAAGAMAGSAIRRVLSARAMVNPRVSRWLAQAADVNNPSQAQDAVRRLGTIIAREPALAGELTPLQQQLTKMLSPVSAEETQQEQIQNQ